MNRRGQAEILVYLLRALIALLLAGLLFVQLGFFGGTALDTDALEAAIITERLLHGPDGLQRSGSFDPAFGAKDLDEAFSEGAEPSWGGRVTLYPDAAALAAGQPLRSRDLAAGSTATSLLPLAASGARGSGNYYTTTHPVDYGGRTTGYVVVELVRRT